MIRHLATLTAVVVASLSLTACLVTYRKFPSQMVGAAAPQKSYGKMYYNVDGTSLAGGYLTLIETLKTKSPFQDTEVSEEAPAQGLYVNAKVRTLSPGVPSIIFGYISYATLTFTPAWSGKSGSALLFEVYLDGKKLKTFDYQIRRHGIVWLPLLPFIWANLFTYSEEEAFDATALQFFKDADALFRTATTPAP